MNNGFFIGGTAAIPILVNDVNQLQFMGYDLGAAFNWPPILAPRAASSWNAGAGFAPVGNNSTPFTGILNGDGYTISDFTINRSTTNYVVFLEKLQKLPLEMSDLVKCQYYGTKLSRRPCWREL